MLLAFSSSGQKISTHPAGHKSFLRRLSHGATGCARLRAQLAKETEGIDKTGSLGLARLPPPWMAAFHRRERHATAHGLRPVSKAWTRPPETGQKENGSNLTTPASSTGYDSGTELAMGVAVDERNKSEQFEFVAPGARRSVFTNPILLVLSRRSTNSPLSAGLGPGGGASANSPQPGRAVTTCGPIRGPP